MWDVGRLWRRYMSNCRCRRTITLSGPVCDTMAALLHDALLHCVYENSRPVNISLTSLGGDMNACLAMLDSMAWAQDRGLGLRCTVRGFAASAAVFLVAQCNWRMMSKRGYLLLHGMSSGGGMADQTERAIQRRWTGHMNRQVVALLRERTRLDEESLKGIMAADYARVYSGKEALEAGLVDELTDEGPWGYDLSRLSSLYRPPADTPVEEEW